MPTGKSSGETEMPNTDAAKPRYLKRKRMPRQVPSASASQPRRAVGRAVAAMRSAAR